MRILVYFFHNKNIPARILLAQTNTITRWAQWIVFLVELNLLLTRFGLSAMFAARRTSIAQPMYTKQVLTWQQTHSWFNSQRRRVGPPLFLCMQVCFFYYLCLPGSSVSRPRTAKRAAKRMMRLPNICSLTDSHRLAMTLGSKQAWFRSTFCSSCSVNLHKIKIKFGHQITTSFYLLNQSSYSNIPI